jgi:hypothetical protein
MPVLCWAQLRMLHNCTQGGAAPGRVAGLACKLM